MVTLSQFSGELRWGVRHIYVNTVSWLRGAGTCIIAHVLSCRVRKPDPAEYGMSLWGET